MRMRSLLTLVFLGCLLLPLHARCGDEYDMGPSVGGGDGSMVEAGSLPEAACAAAGGSMVIDKQDVAPRGGDRATDATIDSNLGQLNEACSNPRANF